MLNIADLDRIDFETWKAGAYKGLHLVRISPKLFRAKRGTSERVPRVVYRDSEGLYIVHESARLRFDDVAASFLEREYGAHIRERDE